MEQQDQLDVWDLRNEISEKLKFAWDFYYEKLKDGRMEKIARLYAFTGFRLAIYSAQTLLFILAYCGIGWVPFIISVIAGATIGVIFFRFKKAVYSCLMSSIEYSYIHTDVQIDEKLARHDLIKSKRYPRWLK